MPRSISKMYNFRYQSSTVKYSGGSVMVSAGPTVRIDQIMDQFDAIRLKY